MEFTGRIHWWDFSTLVGLIQMFLSRYPRHSQYQAYKSLGLRRVSASLKKKLTVAFATQTPLNYIVIFLYAPTTFLANLKVRMKVRTYYWELEFACHVEIRYFRIAIVSYLLFTVCCLMFILKKTMKTFPSTVIWYLIVNCEVSLALVFGTLCLS